MSTVLAEHCFARVMDLAPELRAMSGCARSSVSSDLDLQLSILEQTPYSTLVQLARYYPLEGTLVPDPEVRVRAYHDAKVAEALGYRNRFGLLQPFGVTPGEVNLRVKRELNFFLWKWLGHLRARGHSFHPAAVEVGP